MVANKSKAELPGTLRASGKELGKVQERIRKLDAIIQKLYEYNVDGKISDERFAKMAADYEAE